MLKKGNMVQQEQEPRQLFQPGKDDGRKATADVRQGRGYRQRARENYQKGPARTEATVRHCEQQVVESGNENRHNEQRPS